MAKRKWKGPNRRQQPRQADLLYRTVIGLSIVGWIGLVAALLLFDQAQPEFVIGIHKDAQTGTAQWSEEYLNYLIMALRACLVCSMVALLLNVRRNRRKNDSMGVNLFFLFAISVISLVTLWFVQN